MSGVWDSTVPEVCDPQQIWEKLPYVYHLPIAMSYSAYAVCRSLSPVHLIADLHGSSKV